MMNARKCTDLFNAMTVFILIPLPGKGLWKDIKHLTVSRIVMDNLLFPVSCPSVAKDTMLWPLVVF